MMRMRYSVVNKHLDIPGWTLTILHSCVLQCEFLCTVELVDENLAYNISEEVLLVHQYEFSFLYNSNHCSLFCNYYDVSDVSSW
jgi:hypothetical protein